MRGRKPTPTHLKLIAGNPGKRRLNTREPQPRAAVPSCPPLLQGEARREWRRISKELHALHLLAKIDRSALAAYCLAWSAWSEAQEKLRLEGKVFKSPSGYPLLSPWFTIASISFEQMRKMLTEFGLTPAARARLHVSPHEESDAEAQKERRFFG